MDEPTPEPVPRTPVITVEAALPERHTAAGWTAPVGRTDRTAAPEVRCPHQVPFGSLRPRGRLLLVGAVVACSASSLVVVVGVLAGLLLFLFGVLDADHFAAFLGLLLIAGAALQAVGNIALLRTWFRLHRPSDTMIVSGFLGFLASLSGMVLFTLRSEQYGLLVITLPAAVVTWALWSCRRVLYDRRSCQAHPEFPPAVLAMVRT
ncbi:hypothetical protein K3N28_11065 [Glycomyces sp. TRM65418]|uniref:hypothetical protein n=1 Tax=Glycomyces sp. TRM65418 TaxID=2867006 RepID=UPI001CE62E2D|nr:hypothetical protein [Glycomyces sp. TRM65418]MCC3763612.1 hypothetical protein [Glycomyces sp. TRM65418]QZD57594.1 hypothetical protein K3N28_11005 [Glycomyces sp. TRM65418]